MKVSVDIFDAAGRRVRSIDEGLRDAGASELSFDGLDQNAHALPSGVYFYRVHAGSETVTKKMVIAR
jgi:flagellar hook assembly protein FlgD